MRITREYILKLWSRLPKRMKDMRGLTGTIITLRRPQRPLRSILEKKRKCIIRFNGTGGNVFALGTMLNRYEALVCADVAHVYEAESTAFRSIYRLQDISCRKC